jgi:hypothetical protein
MTDITAYPNPLARIFAEKFGLGVTFENGVPTFTGGGVTHSELQQFVKDAIEGKVGENNLYRLKSDGTTVKPTLKVFYDGAIGGAIDATGRYLGGIFNSVVANDFVERAGDSAVSLDRTKLGQFLFRSNLENVVVGGLDKAQRDGLNEAISEAYAKQNPVKTNVAFAPDHEWSKANPSSIMFETELPAAMRVSDANAIFNGELNSEIKAGFRPNADQFNIDHARSVISDAMMDAYRLSEPKFFLSNDPDPATGRFFKGGIDVNARWLGQIAAGAELASLNSNLPEIGKLTRAHAAAQQAHWKTDLALEGQNETYRQALQEGTSEQLSRSVKVLGDAIAALSESARDLIKLTRGNAVEAWQKIIEGSSFTAELARELGEKTLKDIVSWRKSFFGAVSDFFEGAPESVKTMWRYSVKHWINYGDVVDGARNGI